MATMKRVLLEDPIELFRKNDEYKYDAKDGTVDLWTADEIAEFPITSYQQRVTTVTPKFWPKPSIITQEIYNKYFDYCDPFAGEILRKMNPKDVSPRIIVAGGAATAPYYFETGFRPSDIDFFAVGLDGNNEDDLWKLIHDFMSVFCKICNPNGDYKILQILTPGLLTLYVQLGKYSYSERKKYQFILRCYPSAAAVVHGFDIPSCCTFYDGYISKSTTLGAYAHHFRVNLVNPEYRYNTYEYRLEKYFYKTYAIGFVHLDKEALIDKDLVKLPHINIYIDKICNGIGRIEHTDIVPRSSYENIECNSLLIDNLEGKINLAQLAADKGYYTIVRPTNKLIKFSEWYGGETTRAPIFEEVFTRNMFEHTINNVIDSSENYKLNGDHLKKYLGMFDKEIIIFLKQLAEVRVFNPNKKILVANSLQYFKNRLSIRYDKNVGTKIDWWDTENKNMFMDGSHIESPEHWYTEQNLIVNTSHTDNIIEINYDENTGKVYEGDCSLCQTEIKCGEPNTIILPCGHIFHVSFNVKSGCKGFLAYDTRFCPYCRADTSQQMLKKEKQVPKPVQTIQLSIDWEKK